MAALLALAAAAALSCEGAFTQGGFVICQAPPGAAVSVDGAFVGEVSAEGTMVVGLDRDAPAVVRIEALPPGGRILANEYAVSARAWSVQRVDGLPPQTVAPTEADVLEKIASDAALKKSALESRAAATGFSETWRWPLDEGRISGAFGNQRVLNGLPSRPHYGVDIAEAEGAPVFAPASGVVTLAKTGMHYEGGLVFIDHGQGLTSMYLHLSEVAVKPGDAVAAGQLLGAVGQEGRATGPHLCWRLKWRDRNLDPSLKVAPPLPNPDAQVEAAALTPG